MLVTIFAAVLCMIALQVVLVVKAADLLSVRPEKTRSESGDYVAGSAGRFTGIA
ncbi:hypothetical protein [Methylobacterium sp. E-045]|jgi:hypothetical protein|uniref:hypothetical protein n=1 Tax=Methylobacterium sp. E-045 TaxID=2836575 RepID=UPI001FB90596|nr:hypothetical protein [Methylobacterium sp. E-045]MCJ2129176.1 hypothetical protein [Methylobacterium sp. E-045]